MGMAGRHCVIAIKAGHTPLNLPQCIVAWWARWDWDGKMTSCSNQPRQDNVGPLCDWKKSPCLLAQSGPPAWAAIRGQQATCCVLRGITAVLFWKGLQPTHWGVPLTATHHWPTITRPSLQNYLTTARLCFDSTSLIRPLPPHPFMDAMLTTEKNIVHWWMLMYFFTSIWSGKCRHITIVDETALLKSFFYVHMHDTI